MITLPKILRALDALGPGPETLGDPVEIARDSSEITYMDPLDGSQWTERIDACGTTATQRDFPEGITLVHI